MLEQISRGSVRDWNSLKNNDHAYGFQHVEQITKRLQQQLSTATGDMLSTLRKLRKIFIDPKDLAFAINLGKFKSIRFAWEYT